MLTRLLFSAILITGIPFLAEAHGGHGATSSNHVLHYLTEIQHAVPILIAFVVIVYWTFKLMVIGGRSSMPLRKK